jgi:hypothetical protein
MSTTAGQGTSDQEQHEETTEWERARAEWRELSATLRAEKRERRADRRRVRLSRTERWVPVGAVLVSVFGACSGLFVGAPGLQYTPVAFVFCAFVSALAWSLSRKLEIEREAHTTALSRSVTEGHGLHMRITELEADLRDAQQEPSLFEQPAPDLPAAPRRYRHWAGSGLRSIEEFPDLADDRTQPLTVIPGGAGTTEDGA